MTIEQAQLPNSISQELYAALEAVIGSENIAFDHDTRELFSQDIFSQAESYTACILSPKSAQQVAQVVKLATAAGFSIVPRGGGTSYTSGYLPGADKTMTLDMRHLNRIVDINARDMYITVEAGCTWKQLNDALQPQGLRTPFWGPLSGLSSTVGGGLSQNNAFFGAGLYGPASDSVISVSAVLANGDIVTTGSALSRQAKPFFRHYGPDLTGLFLADAGAFGIKTEATLRLIQRPDHERYASFEFTQKQDYVEAVSEVARAGLACELFGFDPVLQKLRMKRASLLQDAKSLGQVVKNQKTVLAGLKEATKVAMAGRSFTTDGTYSLHMTVEGYSRAAVDADIDRLKAMARRCNGRDIENTIPKIVRADPFQPLNNIVGPEGQRWVPVHGIVSHSNALAAWNAVDAIFDDMAEDFERHAIAAGYLATVISNNAFLIEPVFFWPEALMSIHEQMVEASYLGKVPRHDANPEATALVTQARQRIIDAFTQYGSAHFQVGKAYPYLQNATGEASAVIAGIKKVLDPDGQLNPGALGLER